MSAASGKFIWFELMTNDPQRAKPFYGDVIGWKSSQFQGTDYELWTAGDQQVGGLMAITPDQKRAGVPPNWLGYVACDNIDATARLAQQLGGKILAAPQDIPDVGRFAVLADPQGATFAAMTPSTQGDASDEQAQAPGHFGWAELNTTDWKSAWNFYSRLFNWQHTSSMDMGEQYGEYFMFGTDSEHAIGGMSNSANIMHRPAHWLGYVNVKNADDAVGRVQQRGGKVLNGPMEVPGGGRIAQCQDPQGAVFAIVAPS